ncbi:hypothetical protein H4R19_005078, partial [Coemansia spiralis]
EVECRRIRTSPRLARRRRIDQSVGCPDGSCHVRIWGALSRDVVKPGSQLRLDLSARTSDPRYGLRLLAASFAECVNCHVQIKGEERMVRKISNLATVRLDALPSALPSSAAAAAATAASESAAESAVESPHEATTDPNDHQRSSMRSDPGQQRPRRLPRNHGHRHRASDTQRLEPSSTVLSPGGLCQSRSRSRDGSSSASSSVNGGSDGDDSGSRNQISRGIRKTRSRLAVLLRNSNVGGDSRAATQQLPTPPPMPMAPSPASPARVQALLQAAPQYAGVAARSSRSRSSSSDGGDARSVVRQIQASQVMQIPLGLSQFASEYVSREYRLIVVAEVARLEDPEADQHSVHTHDATRPVVAPAAPPAGRMPLSAGSSGSQAKHARSVQSLGLSPPPLLSAGRSGARAGVQQRPAANGSGNGGCNSVDGVRRNTSLSSRSSVASLVSLASAQGADQGVQAGRRRRQSDSGLEQQSQSMQHQHRWALSEQSSAIAEWTVDVVDAFDVQFDNLVSTDYAGHGGGQRAVEKTSDAEMHAGVYTHEPLQSPSASPQKPATDSDDSRQPAAAAATTVVAAGPHHRRTSSGLVGFLMRGFRSSTPPAPVPEPVPRDNGAPGWRRHGSHEVVAAQRRPAHNRPANGEESSGSDQGHLVMYPLQPDLPPRK